ncbi:MAG: zinc-binding dehydrogenase [Acidobacteria bacterium]|nr:zinc-binding dehydrogenase [Acidobacteriota bacterium]
MRAAYYQGNRTIGVGACVPVEPATGQVQIRVSHCGVCGTDLHLFKGHMDHRVRMPQVIGHEMSGTVEAAGPGAGDWKPGDRVTVRPLDPCGACPACLAGNGHVCLKLKFIGIDEPGAFQALWTVPAHTIHRVPAGLPLDHAALIEPVAVACHDVRLGDIQPGEYAVVIGGGPIGAVVALVARQAGARVLVTEINPFRIGLLRSLGLDVADPRETDLVKFVHEQTGGAGADAVFEVSGSEAGSAVMSDLLRVRGRVILVAVYSKLTPVNLHRFFWRELRLIGARVYEPCDFDQAIALLASGEQPFTRLITGVYPLDGLQRGLEEMGRGADVMKILVDCQS